MDRNTGSQIYQILNHGSQLRIPRNPATHSTGMRILLMIGLMEPPRDRLNGAILEIVTGIPSTIYPCPPLSTFSSPLPKSPTT